MRTTINHFGVIQNQNPNSSGQGFCADHVNHPLNATAIQNNYKYSHSVYVTYPVIGKVLYHCYKLGEHCVSFPATDELINNVGKNVWTTKVSTGSGHKTTGLGAEKLNKHLKSKAKRYKLE